MNQNTNANEILFSSVNPIKYMDVECGEVEIKVSGKFTYEIFNQEQFNSQAQASNMDAETYAKGILLSLLIEEIGKHNGKMTFGLTGYIKAEKVLENGNLKIQSLGFKFTSIVVESIEPTEESAKKMKLIETTKIKSAITGREIVDENVEVITETPAADGEVKTDESIKAPSALPLIIMAVVTAAIMFLLFR